MSESCVTYGKGKIPCGGHSTFLMPTIFLTEKNVACQQESTGWSGFANSKKQAEKDLQDLKRGRSN
jgi:hypothetical protein